MNQTTNYQLNQWEPADQVRRTDFNEDNAKIDAALEDLAGRIEFGTYVGTGNYGEDWTRATTLHLGYQPKLLLVGGGENAVVFVNPVTETQLITASTYKGLRVQWLEDGVQWRDTNGSVQRALLQLNEFGVTYHYIAFR